MRKTLAVLIIGIAMCGPLYAQQASNNPNLSDIVSRMENADLSARQAAFNDLTTRIASEEHSYSQGEPSSDALRKFFARHPDQADKIKLALIHLLDTENHPIIQDKNPSPNADAEEESEHYSALIDTVASLDDERAIPALIGAMTTGGMAERGLLKYGDNALGPLRDALKNPDALVRATALGISLTILKKKKDPASHSEVVSLIHVSLKDSSFVVRGHAVQEIDCLDDRRDFVPILEQIAKTDPDKMPGKALDGGDGDEFYPVRYDARRVLRDIESNKTCNTSR